MNNPTEQRAVIIRAMLPEDLPAVIAIENLSFKTPWSASIFRFELQESTTSHAWVAETHSSFDQTEVVGYLIISLVQDQATITTFAIHPSFRNQGFGMTLLSSALREAVLQGAQEVSLEVRRNNLVAQRLYKKLGFSIVGKRLRYYQDNLEDAFIMTARNLNETLSDMIFRPDSVSQ